MRKLAPILAAILINLATSAPAAVIENPLEPPGGVRTVELTEAWRAGGEGDEVFFGNVSRVLAGPEGAVLVLDSQLAQVQVYDRDGQWQRTLGRSGEGPGEVSNPADAFYLPDGRLCLAQGFPGRLVYLNADGTPGGQAQYQPQGAAATFSVMVAGRTAPDGILLGGIRMNQSGGPQMQQTFFLSRCDVEGKEQQIFLEKPYAVSFADFRLDESSMDFIWMGRMDIDPAGNVFIAPERDRYLVRVLGPDGAELRAFSRPLTLARRTAQEREIATKVHQAIGANYGVPLQGISIEETEPAINGLWARPDGEVWIMSPHQKSAAGVFALLDVFDATGRFTHQLALQAPGDATRDGLFILEDGRVVIVAGGLDAWLSQQGVEATDADAPALEIICYQARW